MARGNEANPRPVENERGPERLALAGETNRAVLEVELNLAQREIGERNVFGKDDVAVAIVASEDRFVIGAIDFESPKLEFFGCDG